VNAPPGALARDADALAWLGDLLGGGGTGDGGERWAVLPSAARPRVLVPLGARRAAAAVLDRDTGFGGRGRRLAALPFRFGVTPPGLGGRLAVPAGGSFTGWVADLLGETDLRAGVTIGPPRPNRKPVVQLVREDGTTAAWAKVACNPLTTGLVANEGRWLDVVARHRPADVEAPTVTARGRWRDHDVLITAPLPTRDRTAAFRPDAALLTAVSGLDAGGEQAATGSPWWAATVERAAAVATPGAADVLAGALDALSRRLDGATWAFGAWHGDLTRWNATVAGPTTQVWDWERATSDRPVGFDAAHAAFQEAQVAERRTVADAATAAEAASAPVLVDLGIDPATAPELVTAYLLERVLRWDEDARLGSPTPTDERHRAILAAILARCSRSGVHR